MANVSSPSHRLMNVFPATRPAALISPPEEEPEINSRHIGRIQLFPLKGQFVTIQNKLASLSCNTTLYHERRQRASRSWTLTSFQIFAKKLQLSVSRLLSERINLHSIRHLIISDANSRHRTITGPSLLPVHQHTKKLINWFSSVVYVEGLLCVFLARQVQLTAC